MGWFAELSLLFTCFLLYTFFIVQITKKNKKKMGEKSKCHFNSKNEKKSTHPDLIIRIDRLALNFFVVVSLANKPISITKENKNMLLLLQGSHRQ